MAAPALFTSQAKSDFEEAWSYLAHHNVSAADWVLETILERADLHAAFPAMGPSRQDVRPNIRCFVVALYVPFYRGRGETMEIRRILHGSRDVRAIVEEASPKP